MRIALFLVVVLALLAGLSAWLGVRLVQPLALPQPWRALAWAAPAAVLLAFPVVLGLSHAGWLPAGEQVQGVVYVLLGLLSFVGALLLVRDLAWGGAAFLDGAGMLLGDGGVPRWPALLPVDPPGRLAWMRASAVAVVAGAVVLLAAGMVQAVRPPRLVEVEVPVEGLHPDLEGWRIALVTDIHLGPFTGAAFLERVVERVNALEPDLVAVTGDMAEGRVDEMRHRTGALADLEAPAFFCAGNHEEIWGVEEWSAHMAERGLVVLAEDHRVLRPGEATVVVGGVSDLTGMGAGSRDRSDPAAALAGAPAADLRLLLAHQPGSGYAAAEAGWDLQLSGHTHGGQFLPWTLLITSVQPFAVGLHRHRDTWIYTSPGTRFWGPPVRLGTRPEITLVVLRGAGRPAARGAGGRPGPGG